MTPSQNFQVIDLYPASGTFRPGQVARFLLEIEAEAPQRLHFERRILSGLAVVDIASETRQLVPGNQTLAFDWLAPLKSPAGYGVELTLTSNGTKITYTTAFDVLEKWTQFPRYGFLCDFFLNRADEDQTIATLAKYHINGLQFYDWQYRHDHLVPPHENYLDPLERPLSLNKIRALIDAAHRHGMAAMPYLTIYAASAVFWKAHPDWILYDQDHQPIPFGDDFLGIMNPEKNGPWYNHLLGECASVLAALPFDGLHIDQFGEPKIGYDHNSRAVDIPLAFGDFISATASQHPTAPIVFNAVGNWPIETLAPSATTFNYIEIWPPDVLYTDLVQIVRNARKLSGGKPVVIALYIPATRQINNLLANALIISAGGTRIELGENARLLTDPYFPKHEEMSSELAAAIRKQNDLLVRFEEWFGPLVEESALRVLNVPAGIEAFYRKGLPFASLSLVNLKSETPLAWNIETAEPAELEPFVVELSLEACPKSISVINPCAATPTPSPVEYSYQQSICTIQIQGLSLWMILLIEI